MKNSIKTLKHGGSILLLSVLLSQNNSAFGQNRSQGRPSGPPTFSQLLTEMDANKDGKLSKKEVKGPLGNDFSKIDTNNDGFITQQEFEKAPGPQGGKSQNGNRPDTQNGDENLSNRGVDIQSEIPTVEVTKDYFISENIIGEITKKTVELSGIETLCYVISTHSQATEHQMGPWCPTSVEDGADQAGIWFQDGNVYDVSGHFIAELDEFYADEKWKLYNEDGSIKVTNTKDGCLAAAKPDVEEAYQNFCVECLPEYFKHQITTFVIPVKPIYQASSRSFARGGIGIALNGVKFDPPAPTHAILAAHTIAPLDDHGGHVNPHGGYHYHAVTGSTKEIEQLDQHAPLLGYAIDGFGIYALLDKNEANPTDLDECGGHIDEIRGYHYHVGAPGDNQIIKCLHGIAGSITVQE